MHKQRQTPRQGRPVERTVCLDALTVKAINLLCWGRLAEFHRRYSRHLPDIDEFYTAMRGEPVKPNTIERITKALERAAGK